MKILNHNISFHIFLAAFIAILFSCHKDEQINLDTNFRLEFSDDTLLFDTVFTSIGSITKQIKVYNPSDKSIIISHIKLSGGQNSSYRINVDGLAATELNNVRIRSNDSLFIFAKVFINPDNNNNPFIVEDEIEFTTNEQIQRLKLVAWGQNANYIVGTKNSEGEMRKTVVGKNQETNWTSEKPYVIYGTAVVDTGGILNISSGCKIYFHNGSGLEVLKDAQLNMEGELSNEIELKGDRFDEIYNKISGSWKGILFQESNRTSHLNYIRIENSEYGIKAIGKATTQSSIAIHNTIIRNVSGIAIEGVNFSFESSNLLLTNSGEEILKILQSGQSNFYHCTFANYWSRSYRNVNAISLSNASINNQGAYTSSNTEINFYNCIVDGNKSEEIQSIKDPDYELFIEFNHCSLKTVNNNTTSYQLTDCLFNPDNLFLNIEENIFFLSENSPLINSASAEFSKNYPIDLIGRSRLPNPDIGAFEYIDE